MLLIFICHNSALSTIQVILSTAHPAKFSEAVAKALKDDSSFDFTRDVLPREFAGLLEKEKRITIVNEPTPEAVKRVIDEVAERDKPSAGAASI